MSRRIQTQRPSLRSTRRACVACLLAGAAMPVTAADPAWFSEAIARLDSDSFAERERAAEEIATEPTLTLDEIEQRLAAGGLSPEQRLRLDDAGLVRFGSVPRAGLGVRFGAPVEGRGVALSAVLDNFPAARVLRPGDIVLSIDGQPVDNTNQMGAIILSRTPGESLTMEVERRPMGGAIPGNPLNGPVAVERLQLDVPLGSYDDLQTGLALTPDRLDAAYRQYQARVGVLDRVDGTQATIGSALSPLEWLRTEGYDHTAASVPNGGFRAVQAWRFVSFAGQPDSWIATIDLRRGDPTAMGRRVITGLQASGLYDKVEEALAAYRTLLVRVAELDAQLKQADEVGFARLDPDRLARIRAERAETMQALEDFAAELREASTPSSEE